MTPSAPTGANAYWGIEYLALPHEAQPFLLRDLLPLGGALNIYSRPKLGKSLLALQLASAISDPTTDEILGFPVDHHCPVLYVQIDNPRTTWQRKAGMVHHAGYDLSQVLFVDREMAEFAVPHPFTLVTAQGNPGPGFQWLKECIETHPQAGCVIIDTFREAHQGDENDSLAMKRALDALTMAIGVRAYIIITHARKPNDFGDSLMTGNRGSSYVPGKMDGIMHLADHHIDWISRTSEEGERRLHTLRTFGGLWEVKEDPTIALGKELLRDQPEAPLKDLARQLALSLGEDAADERVVERYRKKLWRLRGK